MTDAVLQSICTIATSVARADRAWILGRTADDRALEVLAGVAHGVSEPIGDRVPVAETAGGYVISSGLPLAVVLRSPDQFPADIAVARGNGTPNSIMCVPCEHEGRAYGVLELAGSADGAFTFDDVEIGTILSGVAGASLATRAVTTPGSVPEPRHAVDDALDRLRRSDPDRHGTMVAAFLMLAQHG